MTTCTPCPSGGAQATFDYAAWVARYPEFASILEPTAAAYFAEAGIYWRNDGTGPVSTTAIQSLLLNMLTAHIAWLNSPRDAQGNPAATGEPAPGLVGRVNSATEGSVSVQVDYGAPATGSEAWFIQSRYGVAFWQATAAYRTMRYRARPQIVVDGLYNPIWPFGLR